MVGLGNHFLYDFYLPHDLLSLIKYNEKVGPSLRACCEAKEEYAGSAWDALKHIRQPVGFLVIHQKPKKSLDEIAHDLLHRISTMYWDDKYGTHSVSPNVIANMKALMAEDSNDALGNSFLLDDDLSIPFSVNNISKSMQKQICQITIPSREQSQKIDPFLLQTVLALPCLRMLLKLIMPIPFCPLVKALGSGSSILRSI